MKSNLIKAITVMFIKKLCLKEAQLSQELKKMLLDMEFQIKSLKEGKILFYNGIHGINICLIGSNKILECKEGIIVRCLTC